MKVVEKLNRGVEVSGVAETVSFTIEANGKIIRNVISSIYSQKEKTVVRELMANAFDAMAAKGREDENIDVFLPTVFDPTFVVRDYGEGMPHEFVMRLFSVIGFSTKENTNSQTGMFGIGSKSPLSICDTFTVRCFDPPGWNGEESYAPNGEDDLNELGRIRLYTVSITDADVPQISHTFDVIPRPEDRVERGGVEVKVPISVTERRKILEGLADQHFCWFDKKVNFLGALDDIEMSFYKKIVKIGDNLYVGCPSEAQHPSYYYGDNWKVFARQGAAVYPITQGSLRNAANPLKEDYLKILSDLCKNNLHVMIDLPLGTADVTMAREDIQYNVTTTNNIVAAFHDSLEKLQSTLEESVGEEFSVATVLDQLATHFAELDEDASSLIHLQTTASFLPAVMSKIVENYDIHYATLPDVPVEDADIPDDLEDETVVVALTRRPDYVKPAIEETINRRRFPEGKVLLHTGELFADGDVVSLTIDTSARTSLTFALPSVVYVIPSHLQNWQEHLRTHAREAHKPSTLPSKRKAVPVRIVRCAKRNAEAVEALLRERGVCTRIYGLKDMPKIEKEADKVRNFSKTSAYKWNNNSWSDKKVEPDYEEPAYYFIRVGISHECFTAHHSVDHFTEKQLRPRMTNYDIERAISFGRKLGLIDENYPIYRVTENQAERIVKKYPTWVHLPTHLVESVENNEQVTEHASLLDSPLSNTSLPSGITRIGERMTASPGTTCYYHADVSPGDARDILYRLADADELFAVVLGIRWAREKKTGPFSDATLLDWKGLANNLFGTTQFHNDKKKTQYDAFRREFDERYNVLNAIIGASDGKGCAHINYYLDGFLSALKGSLPPPYSEAMDSLRGYGEQFLEVLDSFKKKEENIDDTVDDEISLASGF